MEILDLRGGVTGARSRGPQPHVDDSAKAASPEMNKARDVTAEVNELS